MCLYCEDKVLIIIYLSKAVLGVDPPVYALS